MSVFDWMLFSNGMVVSENHKVGPRLIRPTFAELAVAAMTERRDLSVRFSKNFWAYAVPRPGGHLQGAVVQFDPDRPGMLAEEIGVVWHLTEGSMRRTMAMVGQPRLYVQETLDVLRKVGCDARPSPDEVN